MKTKTKSTKSNVMETLTSSDEQLIEICKSKIEIWQKAEDRAKQYLMEARKRRKEAEKELRNLEK